MVQTDNGLSGRLKQARERLGYTQSDISEAVGSKLRSWQEYERGTRTPGSQVITGLARLGINANWVLIGEGEMLMKDARGAPAGFDEELLRLVIEAVEEALDELDLEIEPASKKADLILAIYDMYADTGVRPDSAKVIKLVKTAA